MKRKIVKQAGKAYTITLPIDWIRENNLKEGNEVDFEIISNNLIISTDKKPKGKSYILKLKGYKDKMTYAQIGAAYSAGIDELNIITDHDLYPILNQTMGYALLDQKGENYLIKDISGISNENIEELFKRVFQMVLNFYNKFLEDTLNNNYASMELLDKMESEVNKYVFYLQRSVMKHANIKEIDDKILFTYTYALEKLADEVYRIWRCFVKNSLKLTQQIKDILIQSQKGLEVSFHIFYNPTLDNINKIHQLKSDVRKKVAILNKIDSKLLELVMHSVRIIEDSADMTHLALMRKMISP